MNLEAPPPHNDQAEERLIGAMFIDPAAAQIAIEEVTEEDFYSPRHRQLFRAAKLCFTKHATLDEVFFDNFCKTENITEAITGGRDALGLIIAATPSAAGIEDYCALVKKSALDRKCIQICTELYAAAHLGRGGEELEKRGLIENPAGDNRTSILELCRYDTEHDPNNLIGNRWLCRGGSVLLIGQSGLGKSSLKTQFEICMALGLPFFGMTPVRPLRILSIQAENDTGDQAEQVKGVLNGMGLADHAEDADPNLIILTETVRTADQFLGWVAGVVTRYKPDLVTIDPVLAYIGGDISKQEVCSHFFRNGLNPISARTGCAWLIVHHTGKPPKDDQVRASFKSGDMSYLGLGSSDMTNWARAVLVLTQNDTGYTLHAAKRNQRTGILSPDGLPNNEIYLKHGQHGICWELQNEPNLDRQEVADLVCEIIETMQKDTKYDRNAVRRHVQKIAGVKRQTMYRTSKACHAFEMVLKICSNPQVPGVYVRPVTLSPTVTSVSPETGPV